MAGVFGGGVSKDLATTGGFTSADAASARGVERIETATGSTPFPGIVLLVDGADSSAVSTAADKLTGIDGVAFVTPGKRSNDGSSALLLGAMESGADERVVATSALDSFEGDPAVSVGGQAVAGLQIAEQVTSDLARSESLAFPLLVLVLLTILIFGGRAAFLPLIVSVTTVFGTFLALTVINQVYALSAFALNLVIGLGLGLGLAVDYTLFLVSRYREELDRQGATAGAVVTTMRTASRTVLYSAATVSGNSSQLVEQFTAEASSLDGVAAPGTVPALNENTWQVNLPLNDDPAGTIAQQVVSDVRDLAEESGTDVLISGNAAEFVDQQSGIADALPYAAGLLVLLPLLVLWLMTGSAVLPVVAVVMNVFTVGVALGLLTFIYQAVRFTGILNYTPNGGGDPIDIVVRSPRPACRCSGVRDGCGADLRRILHLGPWWAAGAVRSAYCDRVAAYPDPPPAPSAVPTPGDAVIRGSFPSPTRTTWGPAHGYLRLQPRQPSWPTGRCRRRRAHSARGAPASRALQPAQRTELGYRQKSFVGCHSARHSRNSLFGYSPGQTYTFRELTPMAKPVGNVAAS
ncbi:MMPL family transporter [Rhodococcus sp. BP22]|uniref:MMPL family transporter n=1 Tax=Rhodococcus sp. BP22 TaxID=2758566 RepID=UPI001C97EF73|nr:MMPL family transporter [Rhodococcus sp. BP22]